MSIFVRAAAMEEEPPLKVLLRLSGPNSFTYLINMAIPVRFVHLQKSLLTQLHLSSSLPYFLDGLEKLHSEQLFLATCLRTLLVRNDFFSDELSAEAV